VSLATLLGVAGLLIALGVLTLLARRLPSGPRHAPRHLARPTA
jgi:hypothetical protein